MTAQLTESQVILACRTLFGDQADISRPFLFYLQPDGARSAYRKQAKENHPDLFNTADSSIQQRQTVRFVEILEAYEIVNRFFRERDDGFWVDSVQSTPRRRWQSEAFDSRSSKLRSTMKTGKKDFYQGPIPLRALEIGRYLYYTGQISYGALIEALCWQRRQRPLMGKIALRWGWLPEASIDQITKASYMRGRFGEKAVRLGLLSDFQVNTLLYYQRTQQERLGQYFVLKGLLTTATLELQARKMIEHNAAVLAARNRAWRREGRFV